MLRATILQNRHEFDAAIADLDRILKREPRHAQALLTRATVLTVRGRFAEARADCERLAAVVPAIYAATCTAAIDSVTGNASRAYETLRRTLDGAVRVDAAGRAWAETLLAEIAHRRGDPAAEQHFRAALDADPSDLYLIGAYSDWLLDQRRADEVIPLVGKETRIDALLLRLALAQRASGRAEAAATIETLRDSNCVWRTRTMYDPGFSFGKLKAPSAAVVSLLRAPSTSMRASGTGSNESFAITDPNKPLRFAVTSTPVNVVTARSRITSMSIAPRGTSTVRSLGR